MEVVYTIITLSVRNAGRLLRRWIPFVSAEWVSASEERLAKNVQTNQQLNLPTSRHFIGRQSMVSPLNLSKQLTKHWALDCTWLIHVLKCDDLLVQNLYPIALTVLLFTGIVKQSVLYFICFSIINYLNIVSKKETWGTCSIFSHNHSWIWFMSRTFDIGQTSPLPTSNFVDNVNLRTMAAALATEGLPIF